MSQSVEARLNGLKALPGLEPPAALEATTLAAMAAAGQERHRFPLGMAAAWMAIAVTGILVAALALDHGNAGRTHDGASPEDNTASASPKPAKPETSPKVVDESALLALVAESNRLEKVLAALPQREVMRVSTAGTIVGLEQQLAVIDAVLGSEEREAMPPEFRFTLMRDRVETMNALLNVRYSQSRAFSY